MTLEYTREDRHSRVVMKDGRVTHVVRQVSYRVSSEAMKKHSFAVVQALHREVVDLVEWAQNEASPETRHERAIVKKETMRDALSAVRLKYGWEDYNVQRKQEDEARRKKIAEELDAIRKALESGKK